MSGKNTSGKASVSKNLNQVDYRKLEASQLGSNDTQTSIMAKGVDVTKVKEGFSDFSSMFKALADELPPVNELHQPPISMESSSISIVSGGLKLKEKLKVKRFVGDEVYEEEMDEYAILDEEEEAEMIRALEQMSDEEEIVNLSKDLLGDRKLKKPREGYNPDRLVDAFLKGDLGDEARRYMAANYGQLESRLRKTLKLSGYEDIWCGKPIPGFLKELSAASKALAAAREELLSRKALLISKLGQGDIKYRNMITDDKDISVEEETISSYVHHIQGQKVVLPASSAGLHNPVELELAGVLKALAVNSHQWRVEQTMRILYQGLVQLRLPVRSVINRIVLRQFLSSKGISLRLDVGGMGGDEVKGRR